MAHSDGLAWHALSFRRTDRSSRILHWHKCAKHHVWTALFLYVSASLSVCAAAPDNGSALQSKIAVCTHSPASLPQGLSIEGAKIYCSCISALDLLATGTADRSKGINEDSAHQACATAASVNSPSTTVGTAGQVSEAPPSPEALHFSSALDAKGFADAIVAARDRSPLPRLVAEKASLACIKNIRTRFPKSSNAYVAGTCACVIDRPGVTAAQFDKVIPPSIMAECGTSALMDLSKASDVLSPIHDQMASTCRSNPSELGVKTSAEAEKICGCLWNELNAASRPQLVIWKYLGVEKILSKPIEAAVAACRDKLGKRLSVLPFQGRYFTIQRSCPDPNLSTPLDEQRFNGNTTLGYENSCTARSIIQIGNIVLTQEECNAYEEKSTEKRTYQVVDGRSLKLTINGHVSMLYKCR